MKIHFVIAVVPMLAISSALHAQSSAAKPEALIKWRQSVFQVLAWNSSRIKANVEGSQYNQDEVIKAANSTAAIANSGIGSLFVTGTEAGKGWHETATQPAFFVDRKKAAELAGNFSREATELARVTGDGNQGAVKAQFAKLTQTCRACHDDFKAKD